VKKRIAKKGRSFLSSSCSTLSLLVPASTLLFQTLSPGIFVFSNTRKENKKTKKKP
jgi:hypothetical protein